MLKSYSTADVSRAGRLSYWRGLYDQYFSPLDVTPADRNTFDASISFDSLGSLVIARLASTPARVEHRDQHVRQAPERRFVLLLALKSALHLSQEGREACLQPGDIALLDQHKAHRVVFGEPNETLLLQVPEPMLDAFVRQPERFAARPLRGDVALGRTTSAMLTGLWDAVAENIPNDAGSLLANSLLGVVAASYASAYRADAAEDSLRVARKAQIHRYVESRLRDSSLSVAAVASAMHVSARYLRKLFESEAEGIGAYILRRRLEHCAAQLISPQWHRRTITETAFDWGFSSAAHFSRVFRRQYGVSPVEYRRRARL